MSTTKIQFDLEKALEALKFGQDLNGKNGFLTPLIKQLTEAALQAERDRHLENSGEPNRKNGYTTKTIKTPSGSFELDTPRDHAGTFEPQLIKKNQTHLTDELERKIISLFAHGNSYQAIRDHIQDMYDMSISNGTLNAITDKLIPDSKAGRSAISTQSTQSSGLMPSTIKSRKTVGLSVKPCIPFWR